MALSFKPVCFTYLAHLFKGDGTRCRRCGAKRAMPTPKAPKQETVARKRAHQQPRKPKAKPKPGQHISFRGAGHGKDTRSRPCSYCGEVAHYVAGVKGYCREHRSLIPGLRLSAPSEHELSLLRELADLRAWIPMEV